MEYTDNEKSILSLIERTDFKNLSKNDFLSYASKLNELRPDVARHVIEQFPELANLLRTTISEYKGMLDTVVASDDASIHQVYDILDKNIESSAQGRTEYIDFADKVRSDLSRCLDNPNLTPEQQKEIRDQEMEVLRMVDKKDSEIRDREAEAIRIADRKDSEKRNFNWKLIEACSVCALVLVNIGVTALSGGNIKFKLPNKL